MNFDENPSETEVEIRRYLLGQLPPAEHAAVEARIARDPEYASDVQAMRWMVTLAQAARLQQERDEARAQVSDATRAQVHAAAQRVAARQSQRFRRTLYLSAAAAVALLAAFGTYFWLRPPLGKRLYQEYYTAAPPYGITQGSTSETGFVHYRDGKYADAITALTGVSATDSAYVQARFYLAQAHMALGQTPAAVGVLEDLLKVPMDEVLLHETEWYLALGYLDVGRMVEARALLQRLSDSSSARREGAKKILPKLP